MNRVKYELHYYKELLNAIGKKLLYKKGNYEQGGGYTIANKVSCKCTSRKRWYKKIRKMRMKIYDIRLIRSQQNINHKSTDPSKVDFSRSPSCYLYP